MTGFYSEIVIRVAIFLYGLWIGGLATTIFNRIPNEIPIGPSQKPRCNNCGKEIKFKYFFPVLGYFFSNGKCVHCGMKIPRVYLLLELSILFYILFLSLTFDIFDEKFISTSLYGAFLITLMFIYKSKKQIKIRLIWMLVAFILTYRGYNHTLPKVIDLFINGVCAYVAFYLLNKKVKIEANEMKMCVILTTSLGYIINLVILVIALVENVSHRIPTLAKYNFIKHEYIIYIPLLLAIVLTFI